MSIAFRVRAAVLAFGLTLAALCGASASAQTPADLLAAQRRQGALLQSLAAGLPPQRPGVTDIYVVGVAADGETDVFLNEARQAVDVLSARLGARAAVLLANDRRTWLTTPLASPNTLAATLQAVGRVLDREEDVLVLFLTSHGAPQGLVFAAPPSPVRPVLSPWALARMLEDSAPRHRVVIVSACYSGVFVEAMKGEAAMVITASRSDRVSFGCQAGRDWTYFGDAFFARGLAAEADLEVGYKTASRLVREWEARDGLSPPSEPQFFAGPAIRDKLAAARAGAAVGIAAR